MRPPDLRTSGLPDRGNALTALAATLPDGDDFLRSIAGPFRRALRIHPRRGELSGWGELAAVPWHPAGCFTASGVDPGDFLDYHTGVAYPQDAASQVPALLLDARPGEVIVDLCAAPGSKSTQIGLALGDTGMLICCDASAPRRRVLAENLARQGIACALVTPMPPHVLAERHAGDADAVLVDAPCSGHEPRSSKQVARMAERQFDLLATAARLVRPGGRMVYSTCTPYPAEDEEVVAAFLAAHAGWRIAPCSLPECSPDLSGLGALRLWPHRQGTEPFFACRLDAPGEAVAEAGASFAGETQPRSRVLDDWLPGSPLHCWRRGNAVFAATPGIAACALPSEARGLLLGHGDDDAFLPESWAAQALIERGASAAVIGHADALRLWAGEEIAAAAPGALVKTSAGAPLGRLDGSGRRLAQSSRLCRAGLR